MPFLFATHCHGLFYISVKSVIISKRGSNYRVNLPKSPKERLLKNKKIELPFLFATHRQDQFYTIVKYHENIPMEGERNKKIVFELDTDRLSKPEGAHYHRFLEPPGET